MSGFSDMGTSTLHLRFEVYAYDDRRDLRRVALVSYSDLSS